MNTVLLVGFIILVFIILFMLRRPTTDTSVPKIIHQTAPADKSKWKQIWFDCQDSWKRFHPDFEYRMWTDEDLDEFMKTEFPEYYEMFTSYDVNIKRIDAARYFILYKYGGIYADMDYMCQKRFFEALPQDRVSIAQSRVLADEGFQNALMISPKGHYFWEHVIERLQVSRHKKDVLACTGPIIVSRSVIETGNIVNSLSTDEYNPYFNHWNDSPNNYPNAKAIHMHTYSWYSEDKKSKGVQ